MLNTLKREGELESATYFHFWGTVIQWKIYMAVDRTEYVCPVQLYLLTSLIQKLYDVHIGNMQNPGKELMDLVIMSDQMSLQCHYAVNSVKVDTSCGGVAVTPTMCMKSR